MGVFDKERSDGRSDAYQGKYPPAANAEMVFRLDDDGMKHAYAKKGRESEYDSFDIQCHN